ncbi:MAG: hypothetical protein ACKV0T_29055 [Planctomycetales bacterium]
MPRRRVARVLCCLGWLDLCALGAVLMPAEWLGQIHIQLGLGPFPEAPIALYLARGNSALYAVHGAVLLYLSRDVDRYWSLIRFLAWAALVHGGVMLAIDQSLQLPVWWRIGEGPIYAATGALVLALQWRADRNGAAGNDEPPVSPP